MGDHKGTIGGHCGHALKVLMAPTPVLMQDYASCADTSKMICMLVTFYTICDTLSWQPVNTDCTSYTEEVWLAADALAIQYSEAIHNTLDVFSPVSSNVGHRAEGVVTLRPTAQTRTHQVCLEPFGHT